MPHTISRRIARETAFQFLFSCFELNIFKFDDEDFREFCLSFDLKHDEFSWKLVSGTGKNLPVIDEMITKLSSHWRIERMSKIDLTLLRLCSYEILFEADIPKSVSINEAIELAKKFGAEDSAAFVNGILDKISKQS